MTAAAAPATQDDITQDRNIVIPGNELSAIHAVRARRYHRLMRRQPGNANIQETPEDQPEKRHDQIERQAVWGHNQRQIAGVGFQFKLSR